MIFSNFHQILKRFVSTSIVQCRHQQILTTTISTPVGDHQLLTINTTQNRQMKYPAIWLRDNCQCDECFHVSSKSRRIHWQKFNLNVKIDRIVTTANNTLDIEWNDNHRSSYQLEWLKLRDFNSENQQKYLENFYRPKLKFWNEENFTESLRKFQFDEIMNDNEVLKNWLYELAVHGISIIQNAPVDRNIVGQLGNRVGFLKPTTYGQTFTVESKPNAKNYAYLSEELPLHTDLPYYEYKPGVNLLHCIEQSKSNGSGENILADGFYIAQKLKTEYPEYYDSLTSTIVDWNDIGEDDNQKFHMIWRAPVICLDHDGRYVRINHSLPQRDSHFCIGIDGVQLWYEAYFKFIQLLYGHSITLKSRPGDILTFNNIRLVHGRTSYNDRQSNVRCIVGAYLDWDIIYSKLRILNSSSH